MAVSNSASWMSRGISPQTAIAASPSKDSKVGCSVMAIPPNQLARRFAAYLRASATNVPPRGLLATTPLSAPAQYHGIELAGDLDETRACLRTNTLQGMTDRIRFDHAAFLHQDLGGLQAALAVLVVDQRQPARIGRHRFRSAPRQIRIEDLPYAIRVAAAGHRAGRAGIEVGHQRDGFLAV